MLKLESATLLKEVKPYALETWKDFTANLDEDITWSPYAPQRGALTQSKEVFAFRAEYLFHGSKKAGLLQFIALDQGGSTGEKFPFCSAGQLPKTVEAARDRVQPARRQRVHTEAVVPLLTLNKKGNRGNSYLESSAYSGNLELIGSVSDSLSQPSNLVIASLKTATSRSRKPNQARAIVTTAWLDESGQWSDTITDNRFAAMSALFNPDKSIQVFALISISKAYAEEVSLLRKIGAVDPPDRVIEPSPAPSL